MARARSVGSNGATILVRYLHYNDLSWRAVARQTPKLPTYFCLFQNARPKLSFRGYDMLRSQILRYLMNKEVQEEIIFETLKKSIFSKIVAIFASRNF